MSTYQAPLQDMRFVLEEWLDAPADWARGQRFCEVDAELASQLLEEGARFAVAHLLPLNASGDREGCHFDNGTVRTPQGFAQAYAAYVAAGWPSLACAAEDGGQGLPLLLSAALHEVIYACNHGWAMYSGIAHGAYECLRHFAPPALREAWLAQIVSGQCLPTMCLTEPQAGSDIGLLRTHAQPLEDGSYAVSGNKLFISGGDHDLTANILHLVLARLPGAPQGSRGISLFAVPKLIEGADGSQANAVLCTGLEHKLGINGSATCSLVFEQAKGWLIGEPHCGLAAMFVMMNSARTYVGLQGLAHAEAAGQHALAYARERLQMRAPQRPTGVDAGAADPIAFHPAMRRNLLESRAMTEGMRAIGYWAAHLQDLASQSSGSLRQQHEALASLLTPVVKAFFTGHGFRLSSAALQVFGGYGYVREYPIEQTLRDSRIAMIYEGTNEIQANDLLLRKVLGDGGEVFGQLLEVIQADARLASNALGQQWAEQIQALCAQVQAWLVTLQASTDPELALRSAGDFLNLLGWLLLGHAWARAARLAGEREQALYRRKAETAAFYFNYLWPQAEYHLRLLQAASAPLPFLQG